MTEVKPLLVTRVSLRQLKSQFLCFGSRSLLTCLGTQQKVAQVPEPLLRKCLVPVTYNACLDGVQAPGFRAIPPWPLQPFGEWSTEDLSSCLALFL